MGVGVGVYELMGTSSFQSVVNEVVLLMLLHSELLSHGEIGTEREGSLISNLNKQTDDGQTSDNLRGLEINKI